MSTSLDIDHHSGSQKVGNPACTPPSRRMATGKGALDGRWAPNGVQGDAEGEEWLKTATRKGGCGNIKAASGTCGGQQQQGFQVGRVEGGRQKKKESEYGRFGGKWEMKWLLEKQVEGEKKLWRGREERERERGMEMGEEKRERGRERGREEEGKKRDEGTEEKEDE